MTTIRNTNFRPTLAALALIPTVSLAIFAAAAPQQPKKLRYNKDVRPILAENCFPCHGPDSAARKAGLRLDRPEDSTAIRNGIAPIVKGNPAASEVVKRIYGPNSSMPPPVTKKKLTPEQVATLKQWIAQGAEYERHWSYIPPVRPALPAVKDVKWVRNSIDRFVLAKIGRASRPLLAGRGAVCGHPRHPF